jgi:hypothetical protein
MKIIKLDRITQELKKVFEKENIEIIDLRSLEFALPSYIEYKTDRELLYILQSKGFTNLLLTEYKKDDKMKEYILDTLGLKKFKKEKK